MKIWMFILIIQIHLTFYINGDDTSKINQRKHKKVDTERQDSEYQKTVDQIDFLSKQKPHDNHKDYLLPAIFTNSDHDEDDDDETPYIDYDYEKETNYKDSPETATVKENIEEVLSFDDKLPLHTAKDNLPIFLFEPENTYVVKNKPATLRCRAANALEIYFKCNGIKTQALNFEFVDPHTGVRIVEGENNVTREQVEEYFGTEKFQCSCFAWTSKGHIRSQPAFVELAYIKKQFTESPQSQLVMQNTQVNFRCEPPPAAPFAQTYWLKNGVPLQQSDNILISKEGQLMIKQATLVDMANYTCVAENLAGKRQSEPALLTIFVNGGWSSWSSWGDCSCAGEVHRGRRRIRSCTAPRPLNGGQPCLGPAVQKTSDCVDCDLDLYVDGLDELADESSDILIGRWSQWSDWSPCDSDCLQNRRRKCLSSTVCLGKDYQVAQCPLCVRTSKRNATSTMSSFWPIFIALLVAVLIFAVVAILGIKYMKYKMNVTYMKSQPGSNYIGNVIKRTLTNQPDLTLHEEFQTIQSRHTPRTMTSSINYNLKHEHLYEVPQLAHSYMAPLDQEARSDNRSSSGRTYACKDNGESDRSDSSCFMSSGSSYANESTEMSPSLKINLSIDSKHSCQQSETNLSKIVTSEGNWLNLPKCGLSMFIPDGAVDKNEELFSIQKADLEWCKPMLQEGETILSPVVRCSPKIMHFGKSIILTFPHFANLKDHKWLLSILQKPEDINTREWRKVLTVGQETPGTPLFVQVDLNKVYLVSEFLGDFVLVGRSLGGLDSKLLKVALYVTKRIDGNDICYYDLKAYAFNDTPCGIYDCAEYEKGLRGVLLCDPKTIYFQENCSDLCFNVKGIGGSWKLKSGSYKELPYTHLWNTNGKHLHCSFILQQNDSINCLDLNMTVYQKHKPSNQVNFNVKTNDLNSNFVHRYSSNSDDCVNVFENPFNYSSLTKKEGRYDFVYKNSNGLFRSNIVVDNNYRTNVLTKSDRVVLCKLLDSQTPIGNDWRMLAEKLCINSYFSYFSNTCSPTENILNLWLCRNNDPNMLINLARIFRDMSRLDCATVVERRCFSN